MLAMQALRDGKITVFGGQQTRPNINMKDMVRVYKHFVFHPDLTSGCYNAGFENCSIIEIAESIRGKIPSEIEVTGSNDPRSYRQDSSKLRSTGFEPLWNVADAVDEIIKKYQQGKIVDDDQCYTVRWMKHLNLNA